MHLSEKRAMRRDGLFLGCPVLVHRPSALDFVRFALR
jgi:hypothetical protein